MNIGLFSMPFHPNTKSVSALLRENHETVVYADELGYTEAYIGEHATDEYERITSSLCFISSLAYCTKKIRLATGTVNLPNQNPAFIAVASSMIDHMCNGRLILGVSLGALPTDWELYGTLEKDRNAMFEEAIKQILSIWQGDGQIDIKGKYWSPSTVKTFSEELKLGKIYSPLQKPHPEIVCSALAPNSIGLKKAGEAGFSALSSNFLHNKGLKSNWDMYSEGAENAGKKPDRSTWRVARMIFVHDDDKIGLRYPKDTNSPYRQCVRHILNKLKAANKIETLSLGKNDEGLDELTDRYLDNYVICGDINRVKERIARLIDDIGPFGTLLNVKVDHLDPSLSLNSLRLMSEKVMYNFS